MPRPARKILDATMLAPLFDSGPAALELEEKMTYLNDLRSVANPADPRQCQGSVLARSAGTSNVLGYHVLSQGWE